ncbi:MAG: SDR family oxidoreductase [Aphanocapsa lilacina HA4352-LM1]|jgi:nucleoside-diphosphate-sugar epimerase|nr:SDR family oxidoreductase [Aphanocapsa lilacina HA4352-LM1]
MKILATGTEGYIGTLLGGVLLERGHEVTGLDTGFHKVGWLYNGVRQAPLHIRKDIRHISEEDLAGYDAIVHLAELSNDPVGQLNPTITYDINHLSTVELAKKAKRAGVSRFVYMSSCSVYGAGGDKYSTEQSAVNPLTAYARCKIFVERDLAPMADDNFSPTFLRNATAYGPSPRMRFDLVVNSLAGYAWTAKEIRMESDGTPWRPFVHVLDMCQAIYCALEAPRQVVHNEIFNVGENTENYQVKDIARIIAETFPGCKLILGSNPTDKRDYKVCFDKINAELPGFRCRRNVALGARQLLEIFSKINMSTELFEFRGHTRLKQIQHLLETGQIDDELFWYEYIATEQDKTALVQPVLTAAE